MRSGEHKAEAERLLHLARTDEGKLEDDPGDPVVVLQLAQTHALIAAIPSWTWPEDVVDAEVVDEEAAELALDARTLATSLEAGVVGMSTRDAAARLRRIADGIDARSGHVGIAPDAADVALTEALAARTLWQAGHWGNLLFIARQEPDVIVLPKVDVQVLHGQLVAEGEQARARALATVNEWLDRLER
jgi:hypothetical protein